MPACALLLNCLGGSIWYPGSEAAACPPQPPPPVAPPVHPSCYCLLVAFVALPMHCHMALVLLPGHPHAASSWGACRIARARSAAAPPLPHACKRTSWLTVLMHSAACAVCMCRVCIMLSFLLVIWMVMAAPSARRARCTANERQAAIKTCHAAECELLQAAEKLTEEKLHQIAARKLQVFLPQVALRNRLRFVAMWGHGGCARQGWAERHAQAQCRPMQDRHQAYKEGSPSA